MPKSNSSLEEIRKYVLMMERLQVEMGTPSTPVTCPIGWSMFETSCYMAVNQQLSWNDASMKCVMSGSKLVEIETKAENDFLTTTLPNFNTGEAYWTGGKDDVTEGLWVWVSSGATFGFLDWNQGEPNDSGGIEDCLQLYKRRGRKTYWNDNYCEKSFNFICEQTL
ncbi:ladderlectin-like isoform X2 [Magallana gigas]|uniref:ladderlectin-like isoform X2 n=1 Tax=Magallana gigas TaxID=29159 RepID=UPI0033411C20